MNHDNRQRQWAKRVLRSLRFKLGQRCAWCSSTRDLQFDCIAPEGDAHHRWETNRRAVFYRRLDARHGLQLLCRRCHTRKTCAQLAAERSVE